MEHTLSDSQVLFGFLLVALLAILGGQQKLLGLRRKLGIESLLGSRFLFLPLGMLLSQTGLGVLNQGVVHQLNALVTLGLGVLGLLLGLSLKPGTANHASHRLTSAAVVESVFTLVLVALPVYFFLDVESSLTWMQRASAAALLGCAAAISGSRLIGNLQAPQKRHLLAVSQVADLSTVIGVLAAGVLLALLSAGSNVAPMERLLMLGAIGILGGLAAWLLATETKEGALRTTLLLGILLVTAGTATHLSLSPVAATLLMGLTVANLPGSLAIELRESLTFLESPLRVLLMVIAGASLPIPSWIALVTVVLFLSLRTAGKVLGGRIGAKFDPEAIPAKMGLGLLPSSAVALGLALDFQATAPQGIAEVVVTVAVIGSLLSETAGIWTTWLLARAHVLSSATLEAVSEVAGTVTHATLDTVSEVAETVTNATLETVSDVAEVVSDVTRPTHNTKETLS